METAPESIPDLGLICATEACPLYQVWIIPEDVKAIADKFSASARQGREDVIGWLERWETETYVDGFQEMQAGAHQAAKEARHYFGMEPQP